MNSCPNCGKLIENSELRFCPNCGTPLKSEPPPNSSYSPCSNGTQNHYTPQMSPVNKYPMKWYKFLIYFGLIASAVSYFYTAYQNLLGKVYTEDYINIVSYAIGSKAKYLKHLSLLYGVASVILGIISIITWKKLRDFDMKAPNWVTRLYACSLILTTVYYIFLMYIFGTTAGNSISLFLTNLLATEFLISLFLTILLHLLIISWNKKYFEKRGELFIN